MKLGKSLCSSSSFPDPTITTEPNLTVVNVYCNTDNVIHYERRIEQVYIGSCVMNAAVRIKPPRIINTNVNGAIIITSN